MLSPYFWRTCSFKDIVPLTAHEATRKAINPFIVSYFADLLAIADH